MLPDLQTELKQRKPFSSLEQEAELAIARTAAILGHAFAEAFKPYGITSTQYNVLRILRGAGKQGLCRHEVRDRLIRQVPDVTRLLDRMEEAELVERARDAADRRLVTTRITPEGLRILRRLDEPVAELHRRQLGHMNSQQLRTLIELLALARGKR
ncbi:MAG: MarR family transcriptional regulator [Gemmatimonadota bacterium]|nr:MarR family transcriptional regulator [Gemmatimonadota bacterium]